MLVCVGEAVGLEALDNRFHLALLEILVQGAHHAQVLQRRLKRVHGEVDVFQGGVACRASGAAIRGRSRGEGRWPAAHGSDPASRRCRRYPEDTQMPRAGPAATSMRLALDEARRRRSRCWPGGSPGWPLSLRRGDLREDAPDEHGRAGRAGGYARGQARRPPVRRPGPKPTMPGTFSVDPRAARAPAAPPSMKVVKLHATLRMYKRADALGAVELVAEEADSMSMSSSFTSMGTCAHGLHRVGVEERRPLRGQPAAICANGLDGADLVVGEHDGDQDGVRADGRLEHPPRCTRPCSSTGR